MSHPCAILGIAIDRTRQPPLTGSNGGLSTIHSTYNYYNQNSI